MGNVEEAKTKLQSLLAQNPSLAQGWLVLGELLLENNLIIEAEQAYSKVLEHAKPLTYSAKFASARLNDLAGKVELAKNDYLELIKAFPYNIELKIALAEFYFFIEQHSKAEQLLLDVVKLDPYHPNAWFMLGRAAFLQGDLNKAVDDYFVKALVTAKKLKNPFKEGKH
ncbi:tetratricopeptide repeat protein [Pseudoalteromonas espejiana]